MSDFIRKWDCGSWTSLLGWSNIISNLIIMLAYYAIPYSLHYYYKLKKKVLPRPHIILCFIIFILLCGTTHLFQVIVFWYPIYEVATIIDMLTALISIFTASVLPLFVQHILLYKNPEEYILIQKELKQQVDDKLTLLNSITNINDKLMERVEYLEGLVDKNEWIHKQELNVGELRSILKTLRFEEDIIRKGSDPERRAS